MFRVTYTKSTGWNEYSVEIHDEGGSLRLYQTVDNVIVRDEELPEHRVQEELDWFTLRGYVLRPAPLRTATK